MEAFYYDNSTYYIIYIYIYTYYIIYNIDIYR